MNDLNVKHNLQLEPMKMHLVVLPGGLKFMRVLLKFINLVMREKMKMNDKTQQPPLTAKQLLKNLNESQRRQQEIAIQIELVFIIIYSNNF